MSRKHGNDGRHSVHLAHHHPGRVRLRSESFVGEGAARAALEALSGDPAIRSVEHRPITGSLLVSYVPGQLEPDEILARAARAHDLPVGEEPVADPAELPRVVIEAARALNDVVCRTTGYRADVRGGLPLVLAGLAGYSFLVKKDRLPRWDNLAYWAFALFTQLHRDEILAADRNEASPSRERAAEEDAAPHDGVPSGAL